MGGRNASERVVTIVVARTELKQQFIVGLHQGVVALGRAVAVLQQLAYRVHVRAFRGGVASADFAAVDQCAAAPFQGLGLNVFFPAWVWANNPDVDGKHPDNAIRPDCWLGPGVRFAYLSYDAELSTNHSISVGN
jgi:hypothetical protein